MTSTSDTGQPTAENSVRPPLDITVTFCPDPEATTRLFARFLREAPDFGRVYSEEEKSKYSERVEEKVREAVNVCAAKGKTLRLWFRPGSDLHRLRSGRTEVEVVVYDGSPNKCWAFDITTCEDLYAIAWMVQTSWEALTTIASRGFRTEQTACIHGLGTVFRLLSRAGIGLVSVDHERMRESTRDFYSKQDRKA